MKDFEYPGSLNLAIDIANYRGQESCDKIGGKAGKLRWLRYGTEDPNANK